MPLASCESRVLDKGGRPAGSSLVKMCTHTFTLFRIYAGDPVSASGHFTEGRQWLAYVEAGVRGIYCEKPLAPTLTEADNIVAACRESGPRLIVAHRSRENPHLHWARRLVESGEVGRLEAIRAHGNFDQRAGGWICF